VPVTVLEAEHLLARLRLSGHLGKRWLPIIGVNEVKERSRQHLLLAIAEHTPPGRIHTRKEPLEVRCHEQIKRQLLMRQRLDQPPAPRGTPKESHPPHTGTSRRSLEHHPPSRSRRCSLRKADLRGLPRV
jgi:hypothetical protein